MPAICFDLEGPLSPQDNAYEVMGIVNDGYRIFEVISRYDDLLTLENREDYEPGDTLKLIVPFLLHNGLKEEDIIRVSERARVVPGARETIKHLQDSGWDVFIISTSYWQHAYNIARQLGVKEDNVACTQLELDGINRNMGGMELVEEITGEILDRLYPKMDDREIVRILDDFFFSRLLKTDLGGIFQKVQVVGGIRKVQAMQRFIEGKGFSTTQAMAVGDSITDFKMLRLLREGGGFSVAFNGNEYSIPYSNCALATLDMRALIPIADSFLKKGRNGARDIVLGLEKKSEKKQEGDNQSAIYHLIEDVDQLDMDEIVSIHRAYRKRMRGEASKLG